MVPAAGLRGAAASRSVEEDPVSVRRAGADDEGADDGRARDDDDNDADDSVAAGAVRDGPETDAGCENGPTPAVVDVGVTRASLCFLAAAAAAVAAVTAAAVLRELPAVRPAGRAGATAIHTFIHSQTPTPSASVQVRAWCEPVSNRPSPLASARNRRIEAKCQPAHLSEAVRHAAI